MAMFRKSRRPRGGDQGEETPPPSRHGPPPDGARSSLEERLREIAAAAPAPEEALDPALRAVMEACGAGAGALCLFDPRQSLLRLTTESGLSDEGCRRLRTVRASDPTSWDMPLHGLLNRRAYLIESAARNRYVPRLVESAKGVRTVACVPIYSGPDPLGTIVLVSVAPRSFGERDVQAVVRALPELARIILSARRQGIAGPVPEQPLLFAQPLGDIAALTADRDHLRGELDARRTEAERLGAQLADRIAESERLRGALDAAAAEHASVAAELQRVRLQAERLPALTSALAAAERECERLSDALAAATATREDQVRQEEFLARGRGEAERGANALAAELERTRRAAAEQTATAERLAQEREAEMGRLAARLQESETAYSHERERQLEQKRELKRLAAELEAAAAHEKRLRGELEAAHARRTVAGESGLKEALEATRAAEAARTAAEAEAASAVAQLQSARAELASLAADLATVRGDLHREEAGGRQLLSEHASLAAALEEARSAAQTARTRQGELQAEVSRLREERDLAHSVHREQESEGSALAGRLQRLVAERDQLQAALATAEAEREQVQVGAEAAAAAQARLEDALERETSARAETAALLAQTQAALEGLRSAQARHGTDTAERVAEIARLVAERDAAREELARKAELVASVAAPVEVVTVTTTPRESPADEDRGEPVVVVVDVDPSWQAVSVRGHRVLTIMPDTEAAPRIATLAPARVLVNLAAPEALRVVSSLRAAGCPARLWGCIADARSDRALALGMIEPASLPLDPDAVVATLDRYIVRGGRVVTAGADVDALMSLRQALSRKGMSVSMAWDAKQAADLLGVVRPHVVVIDLDLLRRDGYAIAAALSGITPVPHAVLIGGAEDAAAAFSDALADPSHTGRALPLTKLVNGMLELSEAPPSPERRQKVRAVTFK